MTGQHRAALRVAGAQLARHRPPRGRRVGALRRDRSPRASRRRATRSPCSAPHTARTAPTRCATASASSAAAAARRLPARAAGTCCCGAAAARRRGGRPERRAVLQPGWSPARPVVVLVHHVHREQWPVVFGPVRPGSAGGSSRGSRRGSTAAASTSRSREATRARAGRPRRRRGDRIAVVHNGPTPAPGRWPPRRRTPTPRACWAGWCRTSGSSTPSRRSPRLRRRIPGLGCTWSATAGGTTSCGPRPSGPGVERRRRLPRLGRRRDQAPRRWAAPGCCSRPRSRRAGGCASSRPRAHGVPTVAYASAGGVAESVAGRRDRAAGRDDLDDVRRGDPAAADDPALRHRLGAAARGAGPGRVRVGARRRRRSSRCCATAVAAPGPARRRTPSTTATPARPRDGWTGQRARETAPTWPEPRSAAAVDDERRLTGSGVCVWQLDQRHRRADGDA